MNKMAILVIVNCQFTPPLVIKCGNFIIGQIMLVKIQKHQISFIIQYFRTFTNIYPWSILSHGEEYFFFNRNSSFSCFLPE